MHRKVLYMTVLSVVAFCFADMASAQILPFPEGSNPPVLQNIGMMDTVLSNLTESDCRGCHEGLPDRHHMLYGQPVPPTTSVPYPGGTTYSCLSCHGQDYTVERDCTVCHTSGPHHITQDAIDRQCSECHGDLVDDYDDGHYIPTYAPSMITPARSLTGEGWDTSTTPWTPHRISTGEGTVAQSDIIALGPLGTAFYRVNPNTVEIKPAGINNDVIIAHTGHGHETFTVVFADGALGASWDAGTETLTVSVPASMTANELVGAIVGASAPVSASLGFDGDPDDPLTLYPSYDYQPWGSGPTNNRGIYAGGCNYCHDTDGAEDADGNMIIGVIVNNHDTHHGVNLPRDGMSNGAGGTWRKCNVCHDYTNRSPHLDPDRPTSATYGDPGGIGFQLAIRICEECHGPESLHNIQGDSNGDDVITVGGELAGYGHVGRDAGPGDSDCWGCHGLKFEQTFDTASLAPFSGPIVPTLYNVDKSSVTSGTATTLVLSGVGFTNSAGGETFESDVVLTAADGSSVVLTPDAITGDTVTVTIPADTAPGNYQVAAAKGSKSSNAASLSVLPAVNITKVKSKGGAVTISGSGFGGFAEGSVTSVTGIVTHGWGKWAEIEEVPGTVLEWNDSEIVADFGPGAVSGVVVESVFGTASADAKPKGGNGNGNDKKDVGGFGVPQGKAFGLGR